MIDLILSLDKAWDLLKEYRKSPRYALPLRLDRAHQRQQEDEGRCVGHWIASQKRHNLGKKARLGPVILGSIGTYSKRSAIIPVLIIDHNDVYQFVGSNKWSSVPVRGARAGVACKVGK